MQIRFPLGERCGSLQCSPDLLAVFKGPISKEGRWKWTGGEEKFKGKEGERRWREGFGPTKNFGVAPPMV